MDPLTCFSFKLPCVHSLLSLLCRVGASSFIFLLVCPTLGYQGACFSFITGRSEGFILKNISLGTQTRFLGEPLRDWRSIRRDSLLLAPTQSLSRTGPASLLLHLSTPQALVGCSSVGLSACPRVPFTEWGGASQPQGGFIYNVTQDVPGDSVDFQASNWLEGVASFLF